MRRFQCAAADFPDSHFFMSHPTYELYNGAGSLVLVDCRFANRSYPGALDVSEKTSCLGADGHSEGHRCSSSQPRKVERSGILLNDRGRAVIYVHQKEVFDAARRRYPTEYYVLTDDKR